MKKEKDVYVQLGENLDYPLEVKIWRKSDNTNPPTWLSDKCHVTEIDEKGNYELRTRKFDNGDYEYISPELTSIVRVKNDEDYICCGNIKTKNTIFSLTPKQFSLLYVKRG